MATAVQELRTQLHKLGYDTRRGSGGHFFIYDKDGELVRTKKGVPITLPSTPGDYRSIANNVAMLRDQGVLPRQAEAKAQTRRGKVKLSKEQLKKYSASLREEVLKLMSEYGLRQVDIYTYADYYAQQHNLQGPSGPQGVVSKLLKHETALSNTSYDWLSKAVSAIKASEGKIPRAEQIRAGVLARTPEPESEEPKKVEEGTLIERKFPTLAFDVMQMIYREDKDPVIVMSLVQQVYDLETGGG